MTRTALIDADVLKYMAGFAVQKTLYTNKQTGEVFVGKKAVNDYLKELDRKYEAAEWEQELSLEPWEACQYLLDLKIDEALKAGKCDKAILCFSPDKTFRDDISVTRVYKGNRPSIRPEYANKIVDYLHEKYECITGVDIEADDVMGQMQTTDTVIATTDKDLDMIPGEHYNLGKGDHYFTDLLSSDEFFLTQLLSGDNVDNIQGIPQMGPITAKGIVEDFAGDHEGLVAEIKELYELHYPAQGEEVMCEMAALLWILRKDETPATAGWRKLLNVST